MNSRLLQMVRQALRFVVVVVVLFFLVRRGKSMFSDAHAPI